MERVKVWIEGEEVEVPAQVPGELAALFVLRVPAFLPLDVVLQHREGEGDEKRLKRRVEPCDFSDGWEFREGDRYAVVNSMEVEAKDADLDPWERDAEDWKDQ